jgi:hypothetical protein
MGPSYCYRPGFNLTCDDDDGGGGTKPPRLLLDDYGALRVVGISLEDATVRVVGTGALASATTKYDHSFGFDALFTGHRETPYSLSTRNELVLTGCNVQATLSAGEGGDPAILSGCSSFCSSNSVPTTTVPTSGAGAGNKYCYGMGCCQARISASSRGMPETLWYQWLDQSNTLDLKSMPSYAFVAEEGWFHLGMLSSDGLVRMEVPILLQWEVLDPGLPKPDVKSRHPNCSTKVADSICKSKNSYCNPGMRGYSCQCNDGYHGNPYIVGGCTLGHKPFRGEQLYNFLRSALFFF